MAELPASAAPVQPKPGVEPVRTCVGCRRKGSRSELVRYVLVDGVVTVDPSRSAPGRGAWLHDEAQCGELAARSRALERALRR